MAARSAAAAFVRSITADSEPWQRGVAPTPPRRTAADKAKRPHGDARGVAGSHGGAAVARPLVKALPLPLSAPPPAVASSRGAGGPPSAPLPPPPAAYSARVPGAPPSVPPPPASVAKFAGRHLAQALPSARWGEVSSSPTSPVSGHSSPRLPRILPSPRQLIQKELELVLFARKPEVPRAPRRAESRPDDAQDVSLARGHSSSPDPRSTDGFWHTWVAAELSPPMGQRRKPAWFEAKTKQKVDTGGEAGPLGASRAKLQRLIRIGELPAATREATGRGQGVYGPGCGVHEVEDRVQQSLKAMSAQRRELLETRRALEKIVGAHPDVGSLAKEIGFSRRYQHAQERADRPSHPS